MKIINDLLVFYQNEWRSLIFNYSDKCNNWAVIVNDQLINLNNINILSAYRVSTFCNYKLVRYGLKTSKGKVILNPDEEIKYQLGIHTYDDRRIEISYEKFMIEVKEIWEERTAIEGFKFDVEPIVYLKKDGKWINNIV